MEQKLNQTQQQYFENLLYFGSLQQQVSLSKIPCQSYTFNNSELQQIINKQSLFFALSKRFPVNFLGKQYEKVYMPCTPAHEIYLQIPQQEWTHINNNASQNIQQQNSINNKSDFIAQGLIKTQKLNDQQQIQGFKSGKRSAIVQWPDQNANVLNQKYYRLKGCGNELKGFNTQKGVTYDAESNEIRGSHYFHTVKRELFMTNKIALILEKEGIQCGNKSVGFWFYNNEGLESSKSKLQIQNELPSIEKYCGVFETLGEKRLATHLLKGFEMLLFKIIEGGWQEISKSIDLIKIKDLFPKNRINPDPKKKDEQFFKVDSVPIMPLFNDKKLKFLCNNSIQEVLTSNDIEQCLNIFTILEKSTQFQFFNNKQMIENCLKFTKEELLKQNILTKEYIEIFEKLANQTIASKQNLIEILGEIYLRIGWEIGKIKRIFIDNDICWGQYIDHHPHLAHCNAHPNNFIILPGGQYQNIIAPLDFDLCFEEKEFVNIDYSNAEKYATNDLDEFDNLLKEEKYNLEDALNGVENMDNFQYSTFKFETQIDDRITVLFNCIKTFLRDTMRLGYIQGFRREQLFKAIEVQNNNIMHSVIKLGLITTSTQMN